MCYKAIGSSGGKYVSLKPVVTTVKYTRRDVRAGWVMAETAIGVPARHTDTVGRQSSSEHRIFGRQLFAFIEELLQEKKIKNHPLEIREGGLGSIPHGVEDLRAGHVRAKKVVLPLIAV
jgi:aspyridone synthetase trans-acting enoyl reductase